MIHNPKAYRTVPLGIVLRRAPGVTRWAKWVWTASAVMPGAGAADWRGADLQIDRQLGA